MEGIVQPVASTGFTVIHEDGNARADIVFVHGIQGHPYKTWASATSNETTPHGLKSLFSRKRAVLPASPAQNDLAYWPRDFLPKDHSSIRVLTFGYDSHVTNFTKGAADQTNIFGHAKNLLYSLASQRRNCRGRPIIFVCHSLGGIVVKETLRRSDGDDAPDVQDIARSAKGILFLGTPHRGGHYTGMAEMARRIVSAAGLDTSAQNLQALAFDSIELELSREEFGKLWKKNHYQVRTFQESLPLLGFRGGRDKVVPDFSSLLDDPSERAQHIPGNHMTMCRFVSITDPGYLQISAEIGSILTILDSFTIASAIPQLEQQSDTAPDAELNAAIFNSLSFPGMFDRFDAIAKPSISTCEWIFEDPGFLQFEASQSVFLSIKGKMGSGKSVMMKHFYGREQAKASAMMRGKSSVVSFFFDADGSKLNRSCEGFLRSLLFQILQCSPDLLASTTAQWSPDKKLSMLRVRKQWSLDDLQEMLTQIPRLPLWPKTWLFVDALDEGEEEEVRPMIRDLAKLAESIQRERGPLLKCVMSSRHYPSFKIPSSVEMIMEDCNRHDIYVYVQRELSYHNEAHQSQLTNAIVEKASGLFLWAVLVIAILHKAADEDEPLSRKIQRISDIPQKLEDLFSLILSGLTEHEKRETYNILKWVTLGQRSLSCTELYFAVMADEGVPIGSAEDWHRSSYFMETSFKLKNYLRSKARGLIEFSDPIDGQDSSVRLTHDSVRIYLAHHGLSILSKPHFDENFGFHYHSMAVSCLRYLELPSVVQVLGLPDTNDSAFNNSDNLEVRSHQIPELRQNQCHPYPFLRYATDYVFLNFATLEEHGYDQGWLVEHLTSKQMMAVQLWFRHQRLLQLPDLDPQDFLQIAVFTDLRSCVRRILRRMAEQPLLTTTYNMGRALYVAAANRKDGVMTSLIENHANPVLPDGLGTTAFHMMCRNNALKALETLLHLNKGFDCGVKDVFGTTGLHEAAANRNVAIVRTLISHGADVNAITESGETPLIIAARHGYQNLEVIEVLCDAGADIERKGYSSSTARDIASQHNHIAVRDFLDARGAQSHTLIPPGIDIARVRTSTPAPPMWHIRSRDSGTKSSLSLLSALYRAPYELLSTKDQSIVQERKAAERCYFCADPDHSISQCSEYRRGCLGTLLYSNDIVQATSQKQLQRILLLLQIDKACVYCCYQDHLWDTCAARQARIMILKSLDLTGFWQPWSPQAITNIKSLNKRIDQSRDQSSQKLYCLTTHPNARDRYESEPLYAA